VDASRTTHQITGFRDLDIDDILLKGVGDVLNLQGDRTVPQNVCRRECEVLGHGGWQHGHGVCHNYSTFLSGFTVLV
jgi:hypothetical protein